MKFLKVTPDEPLSRVYRHTRNDDFNLDVQAQDKDGNPFDFTGYSFKMQIKKHFDDSTAEIEIPNSNFSLDQSSAGASAGVFDIFKIDYPGSNFTNVLVEPFSYYFDIELTDPAGKVFTPIVGRFRFRGDTTR